MNRLLPLFLLQASFAYSTWFVNEPSSFVYDKPEEKAHIEDNLRYSEPVSVLEIQDSWALVEYGPQTGWMRKEALIEPDVALKTNAWVGVSGADVYQMGLHGPIKIFRLPFETAVEVLESFSHAQNDWIGIKLQDGGSGYVLKSDLFFSKPRLSLVDLGPFSQKFLGLHYVWGGTTSFGYDCSGFVRMLYRQIGVELPRNSYEQQASPLFVPVEKEPYRVGDLIFFENETGKVVHVGMMLSSTTFINACPKPPSPWISIGSIEDGIWSDGSIGFYRWKVQRLKETSQWVVNTGAGIVYEMPADHSRVEDMLVYSTPVSVLSKNGKWVHILYPTGEGWIQEDQILELESAPAINAWVGCHGAYVYCVPDTEWGYKTFLPFESGIELIQILPQQRNRWAEVKMQDGATNYIMTACLALDKKNLSLEELILFSRQFLGIHFLFGGGTSLGYDCSGFTQMLFRQMGIILPHNTYLQSFDDRFEPMPVHQLRAGDLIFMINGSGKANHVGMMLNESEFIHTSAKIDRPSVSISSISEPFWVDGSLGYYGLFGRRLKKSQDTKE